MVWDSNYQNLKIHPFIHALQKAARAVSSYEGLDLRPKSRGFTHQAGGWCQQMVACYHQMVNPAHQLPEAVISMGFSGTPNNGTPLR